MRFLATSFMLLGLYPIPATSPSDHFKDSATLSFQDKLNERIERFDTSGRNLAAVLLNLAYEYQVPLALEYVDRTATSESVNLHLKDRSLREIIETAIANFPEYRVSFSAGLIDIYSPSARADSSNIFNTSIKDFSVTALDTHRADMELLCALVRATQRDGVCTGSIAVGQWGHMKISVTRQNAKVYEILNAIVAQNSKAVWIVMAPPSGLNKIPFGGLWHIYPLDKPYQSTVLDKLNSIRSN
jgi:hypothetical protein